MALKEVGFDELATKFENMSRVKKNKLIKQSVYEGAKKFAEAQKRELSKRNIGNDIISVKKDQKKVSENSISYSAGMRGGKDFSNPQSPYFNDVRAAWFHQWGFVTLKKWDKSKRKYPNKKWKRRREVKRPAYHPPDLWVDAAFDSEIYDVTKMIGEAFERALSDGVK